MKETWSVYFILFLMIFIPVLDISGHFLNLVELYIYFIFILNIKKLTPFNTVKIFWVYVLLFSLVVVFTAILASKPINNYDLFILRNAIQLIALMSVLYFKVLKIYQLEGEKFKQFIFRCFCILSLPAVVVLLQRMNLFNMREIVISLYKPQFFFLSADLFSDFRYTSVFKDFFTAGVYFIVLSTGLYYFYLNGQLERKMKFKVLLILLFIYFSQVFVARSSLVLIPFNLLLMTFVASRSSFLASVKRLVALSVLIVPLFGLIIYYLNTTKYINVEWVSEGLNLMALSSEDNGSSFTVMQDWNNNFFDYLNDHPELLILPNHDYDLKVTTSPSLYTDGFYPQEIYRYGIYGLLAYAYLVIFLLREFIKNNRGLMVIVFSFVLLNYKGGNVFFMSKNIYLYAFLFATFLIMDQFAKNKESKELV